MELIAWEEAMNGQRARRAMVQRLSRAFSFESAVETGTGFGNTTAFLADVLDCDVWSVEADPARAALAAWRLKGRPHLHLQLGDSRAMIAELAPSLRSNRTFFYLDAHGISDLPLWNEIELIVEHWRDPGILVDDFAVPGDDGYGFDNWGPGQVLNSENLCPLLPEDFSRWFPTTPSASETGWRRGCVVLARDQHAALLRGTCMLRRVDGTSRT
jgi:hypothetical protein